MESTHPSPLHLKLRTQELSQDATGHNVWRTVITERIFRANETAILICDMWDRHWSRGATERVDAMAPRMNRVLQAARSKGVPIIHAPSDAIETYEGTPARQRMTGTGLL